MSTNTYIPAYNSAIPDEIIEEYANHGYYLCLADAVSMATSLEPIKYLMFFIDGPSSKERKILEDSMIKRGYHLQEKWRVKITNDMKNTIAMAFSEDNTISDMARMMIEHKIK